MPGARWLTLLLKRIPPALFGAAFRDWVRACWPARPALVAFDGKTLRRSHDGDPAAGECFGLPSIDNG